MATAGLQSVTFGGNGSAELSVNINEETESKETEPCLLEATANVQKPPVARTQSKLKRAQGHWKTVQHHVEERVQAKRETTEKWQNLAKLSRSMSQGVAEFFGVNDEPQDERKKRVERWCERSKRMHGNSVFLGGHKMATDQSDASSLGIPDSDFEMTCVDHGYDDVDNATRQYRRAPQPVDPLSRGRRPVTSRIESCISVASNARTQSLRRKDSVVRMAYDGLRVLTTGGGADKLAVSTPLKSRSFSPAMKARTPRLDSSFKMLDDTFFDVAEPTSARIMPPTSSKNSYFGSGLASIVESTSLDDDSPFLPKMPTPDFIKNASSLPSTPGFDEVDTSTFSSMTRREGLADILLEQSKHQIGMGFVGKVFNRKYRQSQIDRMQSILDDFDVHRPFFTYWVTFVQFVCFLFMVMVYGTASIGFTETLITGQVQLSTLTWESVAYNESDNMWIGPRQAHLIHLGAKYSPCMRRDKNVMKEILDDRQQEKGTACCIQNDGSGCRQSNESSCSPTIAKWHKLYPNNISFHQPAGSVCGYDFWVCKNSENHFPPDDITQWPVCKEARKTDKTKDSVHLTCEITARPCCAGILGQCLMTTRDHCSFLKGYFHSEAQLCSQVSCLGEVCGMLPFYKDSPNQFYRLWTSLFIHAGLIPLVITVVFQMFVMRDVEKLAGWLRIGIIYLLSGIAGNLSSAIFLPYHPEAGPTGSQFGILACLVVEVIQSWGILSEPGWALGKLSAVLFALFFLGLLPWIDNYAHITGFIMGFLLSFPLLPHIGYLDRRRRLAIVLFCLAVAAGLFTLLIILFYVNPVTECEGCEYLNCIPFTEDFCKRMRVDIRREISN